MAEEFADCLGHGRNAIYFLCCRGLELVAVHVNISSMAVRALNVQNRQMKPLPLL